MSEDLMLKCLIAFILGWLVSRHMSGDGFSVGEEECIYPISDDNKQINPRGDFMTQCIQQFTELKNYAANKNNDWGPIDSKFNPSSIPKSCIRIISGIFGIPKLKPTWDQKSWVCGNKLNGSSNVCTMSLSNNNIKKLKDNCNAATTYFVVEPGSAGGIGISEEHTESAIDMVCNDTLFKTIGVDSNPPATNCTPGCINKLVELCSDEKRSGQVECLKCGSTNQSKLMTAGCKNDDIEEWCPNK